MEKAADRLARWTGATLFAVAAALTAAVGALGFDAASGIAQGASIDASELRRLRETAPLAALLGGGIGWAVFVRWPRRIGEALVYGLVSAVVAFVFFCALYIFAEALIAAIRGSASSQGAPGEAVASAVRRIGARAPATFAMALATFVAAAGLMRLLAAIGGLFAARRSSRAEGEAQAEAKDAS